MDPTSNHFQTIREEFLFIYRYLKENNIEILVEEEHSCPMILTIPIPSHISSKEIG